jgi:hypothetical protein
LYKLDTNLTKLDQTLTKLDANLKQMVWVIRTNQTFAWFGKFVIDAQTHNKLCTNSIKPTKPL